MKKRDKGELKLKIASQKGNIQLNERMNQQEGGKRLTLNLHTVKEKKDKNIGRKNESTRNLFGKLLKRKMMKEKIRNHENKCMRNIYWNKTGKDRRQKEI